MEKRTIGTIEELNDMENFTWGSNNCLEEWIYVRWDNGVINTYQVQMLLYATEEEKKNRKRKRNKQFNRVAKYV